ncbi:MAG: hypothetical protein J1D77_03485 [Muribaculaceae bacterium]|nr:hypothetical protein [Muribaculaceae bacterium]
MNEFEEDLLRLGPYGFPIDESREELREACWNVLHDNPGLDRQDWIDILVAQYPSEIVDALGADPSDVMHQLSDWWEMEEYEDRVTGIRCNFSEWSEYFINGNSVELFDRLEEAMALNKAL